MKFDFFPIGPCGAHAPEPMDGLVGRGGEDQQLVPLVRQQFGMDFFGQLVVEGEAGDPLDQLVDDGVADFAEFVLQIGRVLAQQLTNVL